MTRYRCELEQDVARAVRRSRLQGPLAAHAQSCATCREVVTVTSFLRRLAADPATATLPRAEDLMHRAQLLEKVFGTPPPVEVAMRRLALADAVTIILAGSLLVGGLLWTVSGLALRLSPWPLYLLSSALGPTAVALLLGFGGAVSVLAAWPLLAEE